MKTPAPPGSIAPVSIEPVSVARGASIGRLRELTPARVGLGRAGASLPTEALLAFTLDHARARDAVHAAFDAAALAGGLEGLGLRSLQVCSLAKSRGEYLRRPDLGRKLDVPSQNMLASEMHRECDLAIVIGDGLSPS